MNEFYNFLFGHLGQFGYQKAQYQQELFLKKEQEDRILLLRVIPEQLRGQDPRDLEEEHIFMEEAANRLMVMAGKRVESLMLVVLVNHPDSHTITQVDQYDNIWCMDRTTGRIYIYENQKTDFYGMEEFLEKYVTWFQNVEKQQKKRWVQMNFTPVNTLIIGLNIIVFVILTILGNTEDASFIAAHGGMVHYFVVDLKEYYRILTSFFVHFGIRHLGENMLMLFLTGKILEQYLGKARYLFVYMGAGILSSFASLHFTLAGNPYTVSGGASGAICGVLGGLLFVILERVLTQKRGSIGGISLRGILIMIAMCIGYGFTVSDTDNAAHLGGLIAGFALTALVEVVRKGKNKNKS